jgi:hypothetical protein
MPALAVAVDVRPSREAVREKVGEVRPGELVFHASVSNPTEQAVRFNAAQAAHPSLVLEVEGPTGTRVLLPPPSPPTEEEVGPGEPLAAGDRIPFEYRGFLDPYLGPGTFRVRYAGRVPALGGTPEDPLLSEWTEFELPTPLPWPPPRPLWERPFWWLREWWRRLLELILGRFRRCHRVWERQVDEACTQTITNAPPGSEAWNGTYGWRARFRLRIDEANCRARVEVRVRVTGTITAAQQSAWETAIQNAWSNVFKLCAAGSTCCANGYTIVADIQFVTSGEHQVVAAGAMTTNMGNWGASDTVDVRHEFGHMLGNLDEYFTVNGTDWGPGRQAGAPIMNNPANPPVARNYELIRTQAQAAMGTACATKAVGDPC